MASRRSIEAETQETVRRFVRERLEDALIVSVSNREPYVHYMAGDEIRWRQSIGGLTVALDPVMQAVEGIWVAHGSGDADADACDRKGQVAVPPDDPRYTLQRVWLSKEEEEGYYNGFSNQALWPLCHNAFTRPVFLQSHWDAYRAVNKKFADRVAQVIGDREALVFVQDYHFALLPRMIQKKCPKATCIQFWHIPWPSPEMFGICPWKKEILEGVLGNSLIGFHLQNYCNNFLDTIDRELEARRDLEDSAIVHKRNVTQVRAFPISVDFGAIARLADSDGCQEQMESLRKELRLKDTFVMAGIDRMDYTKGFPDRLRALDRFLEKYPEFVGKMVLVQVAAPSRQRIPQYKALAWEVERLTEEINWRHGTASWQPILTINRSLSHVEVLALFRLSDACIVSSLQDGMNLVAKEFVAARTDEKGVLLLSRFAGAAYELGDALPINPYALDDFADKMRAAITMSPTENRRRMKRLRWSVSQNNIYSWILNILEPLSAMKAMGRGMG